MPFRKLRCASAYVRPSYGPTIRSHGRYHMCLFRSQWRGTQVQQVHRYGTAARPLVTDQESSRLLDLYLKLREKGVSELIELPQIVVLGDQSSGKSSLLEGLSDYAFPRSDSLCTRFATELVFRRDTNRTKDKIVVRTIPVKGEKLEHGFRRDRYESLDAAVFEEIYRDASKAFGIPAPGQTDMKEVAFFFSRVCDTPPSKGDDKEGWSSFSKHILRIEIIGPNQPFLTIVDVPGLIKNTTELQSEKDIQLVKEMVLGYAKQSRSIILAVIPANVDAATQEVLQITKKLDPQGLRTICVYTKPDLMDEGSEERVINLVKDENKTPGLGSFVVRSRNVRELRHETTQQERDRTEKEFFENVVWSDVPKSRAGISALKPFLEKTYMKHVADHMPKVLEDIEMTISGTEKTLRSLGNPTATEEEQRFFLFDLSIKCREIINSALNGYYDGAGFEKNDRLRLRNNVHRWNEEFSKAIAANASIWRFEEYDTVPPIDTKTKSADASQSEKNSSLSDKQTPQGAVVKSAKETGPKSSKEIVLNRIREQYRKFRGRGLPNISNPNAIEPIFRELTDKWDDIAHDHVNKVAQEVEGFLKAVFKETCEEKKIRLKLWDAVYHHYLPLWKVDAHETLNQILRDEREGSMVTYNHYYATEIAKLRQARLRKQPPLIDQVKEIRTIPRARDDEFLEGVKNLITRSFKHNNNVSNEDEAVYQIHDSLKAYLKVARKRFVDTVAIQAVERCILVPLPNVFSHELVMKTWSAETVHAIAGEDAEKQKLRLKLKSQLQNLKDGKRELNSFGYY